MCGIRTANFGHQISNTIIFKPQLNSNQMNKKEQIDALILQAEAIIDQLVDLDVNLVFACDKMDGKGYTSARSGSIGDFVVFAGTLFHDLGVPAKVAADLIRDQLIQKETLDNFIESYTIEELIQYREQHLENEKKKRND